MPGWINMPIRVETRQRFDALKAAHPEFAGLSYDTLLQKILEFWDKGHKAETTQETSHAE